MSEALHAGAEDRGQELLSALQPAVFCHHALRVRAERAAGAPARERNGDHDDE